MSLKQRLSSTPGILTADVRAALVDEPVEGVRFVVMTAIDGPFVLLGLYLGFERIIEDPIPETGRVLEVDITDDIDLDQLPVTLRWSVGAGHDIPGLAAYLVVDGRTRKLGSRKKLAKGDVWRGDREITENLVAG